jgi:hypothetical protein
MTVCTTAGSQVATQATAIEKGDMPSTEDMFTSGKSKRAEAVWVKLEEIHKKLSEDHEDVPEVAAVRSLHGSHCPVAAAAPVTDKYRELKAAQKLKRRFK